MEEKTKNEIKERIRTREHLLVNEVFSLSFLRFWQFNKKRRCKRNIKYLMEMIKEEHWELNKE